MSDIREINLIPQDVFERNQGMNRLRIWSLVIGLILVTVFGLAGVEKRNSGAVQMVIEELKTRNETMETKLNRLGELQQQRDRLARKEKAIHSLMHKRSLCGLFAELEAVMNRNVWLTAAEYRDGILAERKGRARDEVGYTSTGYINIKDDAFAPDRKVDAARPQIEANLKGMAMSYAAIADFLQQLSESELFFQVKLSRVHEVDLNGLDLVEFELASVL